MSICKSHPNSQFIVRDVNSAFVKNNMTEPTTAITMKFYGEKPNSTMDFTFESMIVLQVEISGGYAILEVVKKSDYEATVKATKEKEDKAKQEVDQKAMGTALLQKTRPDSLIRVYKAGSVEAYLLLGEDPFIKDKCDQSIHVDILQVMAYGEYFFFELREI